MLLFEMGLEQLMKEISELKCNCEKCTKKDDKMSEKKETKKADTKSIKSELIELVNNVDEDKLLQHAHSKNVGEITWTRFNIIKSNLLKCQKELTLEEKLVRDGWKPYQNLQFHYINNNIIIRTIYNSQYISILKNKYELKMDYTEDYDAIMKAVELVKGM